MSVRDDAFDKRCADLYINQRLSARQVAERMSCKESRVRSALKRQGVKGRTISEAMRAANGHHGEIV